MFWCRYRTELPLVRLWGAGQIAAAGLTRATRKRERHESRSGENILKGYFMPGRVVFCLARGNRKWRGV